MGRIEATLLPLVRTKLHIPERPPAVLPRPRLYERLESALAHRLVLVAAPAGYGKTTMLADWLAERSSAATAPSICWLTLEAADNDPRRFLAYLIAALSVLPEPSRARAAGALQVTPAPLPEVILADLLNDLAETLLAGGRDVVLMLDDYHLIEHAAIHRAVGFLVDHLPPRAHLLIATRADPPLPLARLRARGHLAELRAADLSFTAEEAAAFLLETMELSLDREDLAALITRTEGWAAGLHLTAIALRDRTNHTTFVNEFVGNHRYIVDYLLEDVFARQPAHIQTFLLQTSVLDRLCGPLCDAVLGISNTSAAGTATPQAENRVTQLATEQSYSRIILAELQRDNLFLVPLDTEGHWYRYHHLFAEVLRERLISGAPPDQVALLHRRAGAWYAAHGMISAAVDHALHAGAVDDMITIIEPIGLEMATRVGEATLRAWLPAIPDALMRTRPRLALLRAWLATFEYAAAEAETWLRVAEDALAHVAGGGGGALGNITNLRGEIAAVRARIATLVGNAPLVIRSAAEALTWLQPDNLALRTRIAKDLGYAYMTERNFGQAELAFADAMLNGFATGYPYVSFTATSDYAYTRMAGGALRDGLAACRRTIAAAREYGHLNAPGAGLPFLALADICAQRREFAGALPALSEAAALIPVGSTTGFVTQMIVEARVVRAHEQPAAALPSIRRARFVVLQRSMAWASAILDALEAQVQIALGDLESAERLLNRAEQQGEPAEFRYFPPGVVFAAEHVRIAPIQLRQAHAAQAGPAAQAALAADLVNAIAAADQQASRWTQIKLRVIRALSLEAAGAHAEALTTLGQALDRACAEGFIQVFVEEGPALAGLISGGIAATAWNDAGEQHPLSLARQIEAVLTADPTAPTGQHPASSAADPAPPATLPGAGLPEPLSQRELDVLRLVADGHSNQEIANTLVIAVSTVKSHINNIFSKLGVATRTQAIARARRLNLI